MADLTDNPRECWEVATEIVAGSLRLGSMLAGGACSKDATALARRLSENNAFLGIQTIRLWPGDAPQAKGKACEDIPTLTIFEPRRAARTARRWCSARAGPTSGWPAIWRGARWPTGSRRGAFGPLC